jgi:hypothetical protein
VRLLATALVLACVALAGCGGGDDGGGGVTGTAEDDKLTGTAGDDVLDAKEGEDVVEGQAGNDEITGGPDADFLYGAEGDDTFLESEDDAVDVHDCGAGEDFVAEPDTRDQLLPSCEEAAWTARPPSEEAYENKVKVKPTISAGAAAFEGTCPDGCSGVVELRTENDRKLLGEGKFELAAGEPGPIESSVNRRGEELMGSGGYFRIVLRSQGINSGFTTYLGQ